MGSTSMFLYIVSFIQCLPNEEIKMWIYNSAKQLFLFKQLNKSRFYCGQTLAKYSTVVLEITIFSILIS